MDPGERGKLLVMEFLFVLKRYREGSGGMITMLGELILSSWALEAHLIFKEKGHNGVFTSY